MKEKFKALIDYVIIGIVGFIPIALVFQIIIYVERFLREFVLLVHGRYENPVVTIGLFVAAVGLLAVFGWRLKNDKSQLLRYFNVLVDRIPFISTIYRVTSKLLGLFLTKSESKIHDVVYVEYPKVDMWVPAYVTNEIDDYFVLYIPTSPNPTSGFTVMVRKDQTRKATMNIEEVSSFVISVGVDYAKPEDLKMLSSASVHKKK